VKERKKEKTHSLQGIALNKAPENPIRPPITAAQIHERFLQQRTSLCLTHFRNSQENEKKKERKSIQLHDPNSITQSRARWDPSQQAKNSVFPNATEPTTVFVFKNKYETFSSPTKNRLEVGRL
jgi:hypothetical protein